MEQVLLGNLTEKYLRHRVRIKWPEYSIALLHSEELDDFHNLIFSMFEGNVRWILIITLIYLFETHCQDLSQIIVFGSALLVYSLFKLMKISNYYKHDCKNRNGITKGWQMIDRIIWHTFLSIISPIHVLLVGLIIIIIEVPYHLIKYIKLFFNINFIQLFKNIIYTGYKFICLIMINIKNSWFYKLIMNQAI